MADPFYGVAGCFTSFLSYLMEALYVLTLIIFGPVAEGVTADPAVEQEAVDSSNNYLLVTIVGFFLIGEETLFGEAYDFVGDAKVLVGDAKVFLGVETAIFFSSSSSSI